MVLLLGRVRAHERRRPRAFHDRDLGRVELRLVLLDATCDCGFSLAMCLAVYIASAKELPLVAWEEAQPAFYVDDVVPDDPVRARLSMQNVYYLGSHEGCGCGFKYGVMPAGLENQEEEAKGRAAVDALRAYVAKAAVDQPVELFACWEGEQQLPALEAADISPEHLGGNSFDLVQRHLLSVTVTGGTDGDRAS
jgi:hypothetical protein